MALTLKTAEYTSELRDIKRDGYYLQISEGVLRGRLEYDGKLYAYCVTFEPGFRSDGASVPAPFRWFLPSWSETDPLYNAIAKTHDLLYSLAGKLSSGEEWTREECDDFLRGGWRESPTLKKSRFARFRAGVGDFFVHLLAGGKKHWGNDSLDASKFGAVTLTRLDG